MNSSLNCSSKPVIAHHSDPPVVKQEEFQQWMDLLPEEALTDALRFRILHIDADTRS